MRIVDGLIRGATVCGLVTQTQDAGSVESGSFCQDISSKSDLNLTVYTSTYLLLCSQILCHLSHQQDFNIIFRIVVKISKTGAFYRKIINMGHFSGFVLFISESK